RRIFASGRQCVCLGAIRKMAEHPAYSGMLPENPQVHLQYSGTLRQPPPHAPVRPLPASPSPETMPARSGRLRPDLGSAQPMREVTMAHNGNSLKGPRCIALVGPFQSGKTTLLEAILARTGAIQRQGTVEAGTTIGDGSKE